MEKIKLCRALRFLLFITAFCVSVGTLSYLSLQFSPPVTNAQATPMLRNFTVVLDAGHGGEDGGAISQSALYEKDLNLAVATDLCHLLEANGIKVVMTRTDDTLLYDRTVDYVGRKKVLDLAARKTIAEETPNALFVSIHMNSYPLPQYHGLQVWYSQNNGESLYLAQAIQDTVQKQLQPQNHRHVKPATSSIYLLHHLKCPAVLVECGFLSNAEEAEQLANPLYRQQLVFLLFSAIMQSQTVA